ncbi:MAG: hypothetical protein IIY81_09155 [Lachnospiraceae bacterium]|nr:hypothetical protein [Lachnospiraceae bacterium]
MDKTNKKMSKKTKRICIIFMLFFLVGVLVFFGLCSYFSRNKKAEEEIKVGKNQTLLQVQINEIQGNEITFQEVEEQTTEDKKPVGDTTTTDGEQKKDQTSGDTTKQQGQPGQVPDNKGAGQDRIGRRCQEMEKVLGDNQRCPRMQEMGKCHICLKVKMVEIQKKKRRPQKIKPIQRRVKRTILLKENLIK